MNPRFEILFSVRRSFCVAGCLLAVLVSGCAGTAATRTTSLSRDTQQTVAATDRATATPALDRSAQRRFEDALALMREGQTADAQAAFTALAQDHPQLSGALTNLGILLAQDQQRASAIDSFARAVSANPGNAVAWNWLGILSRESGDFRRAETAYLKAIEARADYADAHLNLAILYELSLHNSLQALEHYRRYQSLLQEQTGKDDLMVGVWIRQLEDAAARTLAGEPAAGVQP